MKCFQFILLPRDSKLSHSRRFGVIVRVMDRTLPSEVRILSCTRTERTIQLQDSESCTHDALSIKCSPQLEYEITLTTMRY